VVVTPFRGRDLSPTTFGPDGLEPKHFLERFSKLFTHHAVENEIDSTVDEGYEVHQFSQIRIAGPEEVLPEDAAEEAQYPLWELRDEE